MRSLQLTVTALPDLLPRVQELLLDLLSLVLARRPFSAATPPPTLQALQAALAAGEARRQGRAALVGGAAFYSAVRTWWQRQSITRCTPLPSQPSAPVSPPPLSTAGELQGPGLTRLALSTLGTFNLVPHPLLEFVRDHVTPFLDDNDPAIRRASQLL